jgi:Ca2+-binding RTX toxin-like protein
MRTTTLAAVGLLGLALLTPAYSASAAAETCRGEVATIVGTGPTLTGTEGRDVVVTGTATIVDALGGDDLICATGGATTHLEIAAGYGNDVVDTTALASERDVTVDLGAGADVFEGGAADETVGTGFIPTSAGIDADPDVVRARGGDDRVMFGASGNPLVDVVDLGPGDDVATVVRFAMDEGASLVGGEGTDRIAVDFTGSGASSLDMAAGIVRTDDGDDHRIGRFTSFESADISTTWPGGSGAWGPDTVSYRGTTGDDVVTLRLDQTASDPDVTVQTFGGDDQVLFTNTPTSDTRVDTGRGEDLLVAAGPNGSMQLDLARGVWRSERFFGPDPAYWGPTPEVVVSAVDNVENAFLMAPEVKLVGDDRANDLSFNACRATLRGGAGADRLSAVAEDRWWNTFSYDCSALAIKAGATMAGGPGRDRLRGGAGKDELRGDAGSDVLRGRAGTDVLLGGRDTDKADGGKGRDRCTAERERRCER